MRRTIGFAVRFGVVYALLVSPWPGFPSVFPGLFRTGGEMVLRSAVPAGAVRVEHDPAATGTVDTAVVVRHRETGSNIRLATSSREVGLLPLAVCVGLILATPVPWRQRLSGLVWGLALIGLFIGFRFLVLGLHGHHLPLTTSPTDKPTFFQQVLGNAVGFVSTGSGVASIVPVVIWPIVTFRRREWQLLLGLASGEAQGGRRRRREVPQ